MFQEGQIGRGGTVMDNPKVIDEFTTMRLILEQRKSICRFGDGEFKLAQGQKQILQLPSKTMTKRLNEILHTEEDILVGVPRVYGRYDLALINEKKMDYWVSRMRKWIPLLKAGKTYYSAFITRADSAPHIDCDDYWEMCEDIFKDRDVLVVYGGKNPAKKVRLFRKAKSVKQYSALQAQAFDVYDELLSNLAKTPKDVVIYLALGPTATVLAFDLHKMGYQALDLGHLAAFYYGNHPKSKKSRVRIPVC
jgi:glycosyltransferase family protein